MKVILLVVLMSSLSACSKGMEFRVSMTPISRTDYHYGLAQADYTDGDNAQVRNASMKEKY